MIHHQMHLLLWKIAQIAVWYAQLVHLFIDKPAHGGS